MSGERPELVVILHGIGMSPLRMAWIQYGLHRAGFDTMNVRYPSLRRNIEDCAAHIANEIERRERRDHLKIHFVTHSMGSLVAMELLQQGKIENPGRAVMIGPPYRGSEVADLLSGFALYKYLFGPAGQQLTTASRAAKIYGWPEHIEIGVIAGTRAWEYPLFLRTMKKTGLHDGLVSVASTRLPGLADHMTLGMSHSFLIEKSVSYAIRFLKAGRFNLS